MSSQLFHWLFTPSFSFENSFWNLVTFKCVAQGSPLCTGQARNKKLVFGRHLWQTHYIVSTDNYQCNLYKSERNYKSTNCNWRKSSTKARKYTSIRNFKFNPFTARCNYLVIIFFKRGPLERIWEERALTFFIFIMHTRCFW